MRTDQEIFDTIVTHLRQQGVPARNENGDCFYRTPDGLKCAVGCLISDKDYNSSFEGKSINLLLRDPIYNLPLHLMQELQPHRLLISELQAIHDFENNSNWEKEFAIIARRYHLEYQAPDTT